MTCYNPSPRPLRATEGLTFPASWESLATPAAVVIAPWNARRVVVGARSGGGEERSVVKARIEYKANNRRGATYVHSVPVDIFTKTPSP